MKIALLCSGLGHINRGHEVFARGLFDLLKADVNITLFKGGGVPASNEQLIPSLPRRSACLDHIHIIASPKWADSLREQERERIEAVTFAYAALRPLLEGGFDVIHCLERDVCEIIYAHRHLFERTPRVVFSNGGAIPARDLPPCDFVQEHTEYNLVQSARDKAFMIPHGVDLTRFHPNVESDFRARHGIPDKAFLAISVGTICYWHKRMDHVIRELAPLQDVYLAIVGQESDDSPAIKKLGHDLMGDRIVFTTLSHDVLPQAYAAADAFVLGSLFETFGIVYIEAMAMGLPVICTEHPNQKGIVKEGVFVDMGKEGALREVMQKTDRARLRAIGAKGPVIVREHYDLQVLKGAYLTQYAKIAAAPAELPRYTLGNRIRANLNNAARKISGVFR